MKARSIDPKSLIIGLLSGALLVMLLGAAADSFTPDEVARLKNFAAMVQPDGNLNLGNKKIIMLGSSIYDDASEGGGLIIRGGSGRIHLHGDQILDGNITPERETIELRSNVNLGNKKIIMLGSSIYDDASEGGGLILRGGGMRIHLHGDQILDGNITPERDTIDLIPSCHHRSNVI